MKTLRNILFFAALSVSYFACKKDEGDLTMAARPVIESYLIAGKPVTIKVYDQKGLLDTASYGAPITGLSLSFTSGTKTVKLNEIAAGVYSSSDPDLIVPGKSCAFSFDYNGYTVSAETAVPGVPVNFKASSLEQVVPDPMSDTSQTSFNSITFSWSNPDGGYYLMIFRNRESSPTRIGKFGFGSYRTIEEYLAQASSFKTQRMTFNFAGYYDTYLYHVNSEYNNIINSSANSSLNLTNPPTNIKNGLGIFTAMSCDSLLLHVYE